MLAKALEIGAGGKLNQIVVENEVVGSALFKKNCFNYQVTFIPINKIVGREIPLNILQNARDIAAKMKGQVASPMEVISFSSEIKPAILYVFGNFLICSSNEIAKMIVFH